MQRFSSPFLFERSHQAGLVFPGIILLFTAGVAFLITLEIIDDDAQDIIADYWPLLLAFIGITLLLPSALTRRIMTRKPLRIAVDASRTTVAQRTGTENYALRLLQQLAQQNTHHQLHYYFRDAVPADLFTSSDNLTQHVIPWPRMWTHLRFAAELWRTRPQCHICAGPYLAACVSW